MNYTTVYIDTSTCIAYLNDTAPTPPPVRAAVMRIVPLPLPSTTSYSGDDSVSVPS
jgi:hypothetical protein